MLSIRLLACLLVAYLSMSDARAAVNVLGFEMGKATMDEINLSVSKHGTIADNGTNKYSGGPMLKAPGSSFDIEGLDDVIFIFDPDHRLIGVVMDMDKSRFDSVLARLKSKYHLVSQTVPLVGNKTARFHDGSTTIDIDAPHMSFAMQVRYAEDGLLNKFGQDRDKEQKDKSAKEAAQF